MNTKAPKSSKLLQLLLRAMPCLVLACMFNLTSKAQNDDGETAVCTIKVNDKLHTLKSNQAGAFSRVSNIKPLQVVPVEVRYPAGKPGEKVVISVEDGGKLENNKSAMALHLDNGNKLSFKFHVTENTGLYRITLFKGNDTKTIQLWVGSHASLSKN